MRIQKSRDLVEPFRQAELRRAVSCAGDDLQSALHPGILKRLVQSSALDKRHYLVPIPMKDEKRRASAKHMMKPAHRGLAVMELGRKSRLAAQSIADAGDDITALRKVTHRAGIFVTAFPTSP